MEQNELEVEEVDDIVETKDDEGNDLTDWKAEALKNQGIAKRFKTKLEKAKELFKSTDNKPEAKPNPEKPVKEGFDYAELAYLTAKGISDEDISFVEETVKSTSKPLNELLGTKWFQAELQERKEARETQNALPIGSKRSGAPSGDNADVWLAKIEAGKATVLDIPDTELRRKVVKMRGEKGGGSKFTDTPVVG